MKSLLLYSGLILGLAALFLQAEPVNAKMEKQTILNPEDCAVLRAKMAKESQSSPEDIEKLINCSISYKNDMPVITGIIRPGTIQMMRMPNYRLFPDRLVRSPGGLGG